MLPSHPNSPYSKTVNGIRPGNKYRQVNEEKPNMIAIDVKKIHQAHKISSEYPTRETNPYHHHHDHRSHQRHQQYHHPIIGEQPIIRSIDTNKILLQTTPNIRTTSKPRQCTNCCGGLPGCGPGSGLTVTNTRQSVQGQCCCQNKTTVPQVFIKHSGTMNISHEIPFCPDDKRLRGGGSTNKFSYPWNFSPSSAGSTNEETSWNEDFEKISKTDNTNIRSRGGCGGCDFPQSIKSYSAYNYASRDQCQPSPCPSSYKYPRRRPCPPLMPVCFTQRKTCAPENFQVSTKACCPCGGCGGAACTDNPGGGQIDGGCCGGSHVKPLPCKCKCQSCKDFHPCGGCGGQSCGKIYSCAGSSGGTCCFPRNYKRRSGPECCGGGNSGCGGCC